MLDVGWSELLLIGVVALIVIGPEDLPKLFHTLGRITARARSMAREFTSAMEDAAKGSGIGDVTKDIRDLKSLTSKKSLGLDALDRAATRFEQWDPKASLEKGTQARPDPAAPVAPAETRAENRAVDAPAVPAAMQAANDPVAAAPDSPRRIAGVRRSDMKDH
ncbi:Sec-independent protein translocase protein TatB [Paracoccus benzoatiresistens]|uniref:Sec-independent protein translocase protein TatB n=1 Tax=Paracoccus benzoatiresistens TaxID=2997341 RepID=A0ABT4J102_9RHOB|nr:Sec-independent protein translocase protein TatB [Paracoccus sp. EF6]MCZ0960781.1 Sec-independent protein translocase protein TatB [Paracoccus sp. EF6]